jgi:hypothetical protein
MSSPRIDRPTAPRPHPEPVLAATGAAAALVAQLLTDGGDLWVVLDAAALLAAAFGVARLLRSVATDRGRPALAELSSGVVTGGISAAVGLLGVFGPEAHLGAVVLMVAAGMGTVLTLLILSGATARYLREGRAAGTAAGTGSGTGTGTGTGTVARIGRTASLVTLLAAAVVVALAVLDAVTR